MKTKCHKMLTCNLYVFYFLLCCAGKVRTRSFANDELQHEHRPHQAPPTAYGHPAETMDTISTWRHYSSHHNNNKHIQHNRVPTAYERRPNLDGDPATVPQMHYSTWNTPKYSTIHTKSVAGRQNVENGQSLTAHNSKHPLHERANHMDFPLDEPDTATTFTPLLTPAQSTTSRTIKSHHHSSTPSPGLVNNRNWPRSPSSARQPTLSMRPQAATPSSSVSSPTSSFRAAPLQPNHIQTNQFPANDVSSWRQHNNGLTQLASNRSHTRTYLFATPTIRPTTLRPDLMPSSNFAASESPSHTAVDHHRGRSLNNYGRHISTSDRRPSSYHRAGSERATKPPTSTTTPVTFRTPPAKRINPLSSNDVGAAGNAVVSNQMNDSEGFLDDDYSTDDDELANEAEAIQRERDDYYEDDEEDDIEDGNKLLLDAERRRKDRLFVWESDRYNAIPVPNDLDSGWMNDEYDEQDYPNDESFGELTNEKWEQLGTDTAVERSRRLVGRPKSNAEIQNELAVRHAIRTPPCGVPRPRVIRMTDPDKSYVPHCTELHRCGEDTGCCGNTNQTCMAKRSETVILAFYVTSRKSGFTTFQNVSFLNDTECGCQSPALPFQCRCPSAFEPIVERTNSWQDCECRCRPDHYECLELLAGTRQFPVKDIICIRNRMCTAPYCLYGNFNQETGSCMNREDKLVNSIRLRRSRDSDSRSRSRSNYVN